MGNVATRQKAPLSTNSGSRSVTDTLTTATPRLHCSAGVRPIQCLKFTRLPASRKTRRYIMTHKCPFRVGFYLLANLADSITVSAPYDLVAFMRSTNQGSE